MHAQLRDADVASAELVEEKRLSRSLSAQVQEFTDGGSYHSSSMPCNVCWHEEALAVRSLGSTECRHRIPYVCAGSVKLGGC